MGQQERSPWVYIGIGCLFLLALIAAVAVSCGVVGYQWVRELRSTMEDPELRSERIHNLLGADSLPAGYHPAFSFSIPLILDLAILSDQESVVAEPRSREREFIFVDARDFGDNRSQLREFLEGKRDETEVLANVDVGFDPEEFIRRGNLEFQQGDLYFVSYRGRVRSRGQRHEGVATLFSLECPQDPKLKIGIWFGPDPEPDSLVEEADFSGSPADEAAMRDFLSHFSLCGAG